jgi:hypothetical protein
MQVRAARWWRDAYMMKAWRKVVSAVKVRWVEDASAQVRWPSTKSSVPQYIVQQPVVILY